MSEVEKYDLLKESCELDDRIEGAESELQLQKAHVRWLERQIERMREQKAKIDAVLAAETRKRSRRRGPKKNAGGAGTGAGESDA